MRSMFVRTMCVALTLALLAPCVFAAAPTEEVSKRAPVEGIKQEPSTVANTNTSFTLGAGVDLADVPDMYP